MHKQEAKNTIVRGINTLNKFIDTEDWGNDLPSPMSLVEELEKALKKELQK